MKTALKFFLGFVVTFFAMSVLMSTIEAPEMTWWMIGLSLVAGIAAPQGVVLSIINPADLTFNGEEIRSLSEAVFEQVFMKPGINEFHTIVPGIVAKKQIALLGRFGLVGRKGTGCSPTVDGNTITNSEKFWEPEDIETRLVQCWDDIKETFFIWGQKQGLKRPDLTGTDFVNFIEDRLGDALEEANLRIIWFNDVDHALTTASPAGNVTAGTTIGYFNIIDGLWKQIFSVVTATPARQTVIAENALGTKALQLALAADTAIVTFRAMIEDADKRLKNHPDKILLCTDTLFDNWLTFKETQSVDQSFVRQEKGFTMDTYRGVTIIKFDFWDRIIQTFFDSDVGGTGPYHLPHRALLTTKANLQVGVETESALAELDIFYDQREKDVVIDSLYKLDAKEIEDYMIQAAY